MKIFTRAFWASAAEKAIVTGASTFAGSLVLTTTPSWKGLVAAGTAAGMAALYAFVRQLSAVQTTNAIAELGVKKGS